MHVHVRCIIIYWFLDEYVDTMRRNLNRIQILISFTELKDVDYCETIFNLFQINLRLLFFTLKYIHYLLLKYIIRFKQKKTKK